MTDDSWRESAACQSADPEIFFPEGLLGETMRLARARSYCRACPVTVPCLEYALATGSHGIWASTTLRQRARMQSIREFAV